MVHTRRSPEVHRFPPHDQLSSVPGVVVHDISKQITNSSAENKACPAAVVMATSRPKQVITIVDFAARRIDLD
jgi:hypothetical protein